MGWQRKKDKHLSISCLVFQTQNKNKRNFHVGEIIGFVICERKAKRKASCGVALTNGDQACEGSFLELDSSRKDEETHVPSIYHLIVLLTICNYCKGDLCSRRCMATVIFDPRLEFPLLTSLLSPRRSQRKPDMGLATFRLVLLVYICACAMVIEMDDWITVFGDIKSMNASFLNSFFRSCNGQRLDKQPSCTVLLILL